MYIILKQRTGINSMYTILKQWAGITFMYPILKQRAGITFMYTILTQRAGINSMYTILKVTEGRDRLHVHHIQTAVLRGYRSRKRDEKIAFANQVDFTASTVNECAMRHKRYEQFNQFVEL